MMRRKHAMWAAVAVALGALAGFHTFAQDTGRDQNVVATQAEGAQVHDNITAYRAGEGTLTGAEAVDLDSTVIGNLIVCGGFQTISVCGTMSVADATVELRAHRFYRNPATGVLTYRGTDTQTLTAGAAGGDTSDSGRFPATQTMDIQTRGSTHVRITVGAVSSGNFKFVPATVW